MVCCLEGKALCQIADEFSGPLSDRYQLKRAPRMKEVTSGLLWRLANS